MNDKNLTTVTMEEIWKSKSDGFIPALLEIYNPDIKWEEGNSMEQENCYLRVVSNTESVKYKGKRYLPCKFDFTMPEENGQKIGSASLTVSAIDSRIIEILRSIDIPCEITIKAFFAKKTDNNGRELVMFHPIDSLTATAPTVTYDKTTAKFNLVFKDALQINIPSAIATQDKLPSVVEQ